MLRKQPEIDPKKEKKYEKSKTAWGAPADTRWGKRGIALFLSAVMCLTMLPGVAFAEENTATTTDEYGFDLSTPSGFNANDGVHPLRSGK